MTMKKKIGQVILDDRFYPGKDLYSDGAVEDELLEIAEITPPIGLRDDRYPQPHRFQRPSDHGGTKRRMVHIRVAAEQDHIQVVPAARFYLFFGCRQPCLWFIRFHVAKIRKIQYPANASRGNPRAVSIPPIALPEVFRLVDDPVLPGWHPRVDAELLHKRIG